MMRTHSDFEEALVIPRERSGHNQKRNVKQEMQNSIIR